MYLPEYLDYNILANGVDSDQTDHLGAVWSGSTLFSAQCLLCLPSSKHFSLISS